MHDNYFLISKWLKAVLNLCKSVKTVKSLAKQKV